MPLLRVGRDGFPEYAQGHERRITPVVGIAMTVEAVTGVDRRLLVVAPDTTTGLR